MSESPKRMAPLRRRQVMAAVALAGLIAVAVGVALGSGASGSTGVTAPPTDLSTGLKDHGTLFVPANAADAAAAPVSADQAEQVATKQETDGQLPPSASVNAYLGRLTEENRLEAPPADIPKPPENEPPTPPPSVDRLAYAVQIQGIQEYPTYGPITPERVHNELVVFVDASTGQEIFSTTFR
jgi:hypothetical protein